jgi:hypothetical protein
VVYFLIGPECRKEFESRIAADLPELASNVRAIDYPMLVECQTAAAGAYVFTGCSLFTPGQRELATRIERGLEGHSRIFNRPSRVSPRAVGSRLALSAFQDRAGPDSHAGTERATLVVSVEDVIGCTDSPVLENEWDLREAVTRMILMGFDPDRMHVRHLRSGDDGPSKSLLIVASAGSSSAGLQHVPLHTANHCGLDFCRVELNSRGDVWRVDDGPLALLPRGSEREPFLRFLRQIDSHPHAEHALPAFWTDWLASSKSLF